MFWCSIISLLWIFFSFFCFFKVYVIELNLKVGIVWPQNVLIGMDISHYENRKIDDDDVMSEGGFVEEIFMPDDLSEVRITYLCSF